MSNNMVAFDLTKLAALTAEAASMVTEVGLESRAATFGKHLGQRIDKTMTTQNKQVKFTPKETAAKKAADKKKAELKRRKILCDGGTID